VTSSSGEPLTCRVAILGATGLVGRTLLEVLERRAFPTETPRLLASERSDGRTLRFRGQELQVEPVSDAAFDGIDLALFASANAVSQSWAGPARARGARVIDNSSAFRYHDEVPLVVPEVNGALLESRPPLVANPNCSTIAIVLPLAALAPVARLERLVVATYQSVSGAGSDSLAELERGVRDGLEGPPPPRPGGLAPFAFNVVPHIDRFEDNGYSREEMKIVWESRKILGLPELPVTATAVRVPVRVGHSVAVWSTWSRTIEPDEAREHWRRFPGIEVVDDPGQNRYPTPLAVAGRDPVLVGRARRDLSDPRGLVFFVSSDNLLKGAALNAVQIAERLCRQGVAA
jgi:aspartate-semialdehyde dehydrogenase